MLPFYYPAPGNYATTQGTVNIPAAGYYYNVPLNAVPAPVNPVPAQGFTYSSFYCPFAPSSGYRADPNVRRSNVMTGSAYVSGDGQTNPNW